MSEVLLVNPPCAPEIREYARPDYPHMGLGYLSSFLLRRDVNCGVIDCKLENLKLDEAACRITSTLSNNKSSVLGLTAFTEEISRAARLAELVKKRLPNVATIVGGVHGTFLPEETLHRYPFLDFVVIGEGEITLYELVRIIAEGGDPRGVPGIAYREAGCPTRTPARAVIKGLDELPFPAWHLFPRFQTFPVQTARGCPFDCIFCSRPWGKTVRYRSAENVVEEIAANVDVHHASKMWFLDETFGMNKKRTMQILDLMIHRGLNQQISWRTQTRVDCVDLEMLSLMKTAGCTEVSFGVESGNEEILMLSRKRITKDEARNAVRLSKKVGLGTGTYFILGFPHENEATLDETIDFAAECNSDHVSFGIMVPFPGTEVAEMARKGYGGLRLASNDWDEYGKNIGKALELEQLSRAKLERAQLRAYMHFYLRNRRYRDLLKFAWRIKEGAPRAMLNHLRSYAPGTSNWKRET